MPQRNNRFIKKEAKPEKLPSESSWERKEKKNRKKKKRRMRPKGFQDMQPHG